VILARVAGWGMAEIGQVDLEEFPRWIDAASAVLKRENNG
jgi:hypothetical protein